MTITTEEYVALITKAAKWDALVEKISKYYDEEGLDKYKDDVDLATIGEECVVFLGLM